MKKCFLMIIVIILTGFGSFAQNNQTEAYVFSQLKTYHSTKLWGTVIEKAEDFFFLHPFSAYENEVLFFQGESYFHLNKFADSYAIFNALLLDDEVTDSSKKNIHYYLGQILVANGEYEKALDYFYLLVENPFTETEKNKNVLLNTAYSLSALKRHDELMSVIGYYITQYGDNTIPLEIEGIVGSLWLGLGAEAFENRRFIEALEYLNRADLQKVDGVKSPSHYEKSGLYQASIHYMLGDSLSAVHILEERYNFESVVAFEYATLLAILLSENFEVEKSEQYVDDAIDLVNKNSTIPKTHINFTLLENALYYSAIRAYNESNYEKVVQTFELLTLLRQEKFDSLYAVHHKFELLNAQSLFLLGNEDIAIELLEKNFSNSIETAKALFLSEQWDKASQIALENDDEYLKGIAYMHHGKWALAHESFASVLSNSEMADWVSYYKGLSLYYRGEYSESLHEFSSFVTEYPYHAKIWEAQFISAVCFLQTGQATQALEHSLKALRIAKTNEQRQMATMFAAGLYIDEKNYSQANGLLTEYSFSNDVQSIAPRILLAETYEKLGQVSMADNELERIVLQFPREELAREAAYKRGELYFNSGDYLQSEKLFREFRLSYPVGSYSDIALYFEAESRNKQDDVNGAILLFNDLVQRYVNSSYRFSAINTLVTLHRNIGEFGTALEMAERAQNEYPDDFAASSLNVQIEELSILESGVNEEIATTQFNWQRAGENNTQEGRLLAYQLVELYLQNTGEVDSALNLLRDLHSRLGSIAGEYTLHADVLDLLGKIERERGNCEIAARYYLQEVEALVNIGNVQEQLEKSMYSAVEAFDCAGKIADANAVYEEMEKKYNTTIWFDRAKSIVNNYQ